MVWFSSIFHEPEEIIPEVSPAPLVLSRYTIPSPSLDVSFKSIPWRYTPSESEILIEKEASSLVEIVCASFAVCSDTVMVVRTPSTTPVSVSAESTTTIHSPSAR